MNSLQETCKIEAV